MQLNCIYFGSSVNVYIMQCIDWQQEDGYKVRHASRFHATQRNLLLKHEVNTDNYNNKFSLFCSTMKRTNQTRLFWWWYTLEMQITLWSDQVQYNYIFTRGIGFNTGYLCHKCHKIQILLVGILTTSLMQ